MGWCDDESDFFEKEFSRILKRKGRHKHIKNDKLKQSFNLLSNNKTKYPKPPQESGEFLDQIKMWDKKVLKRYLVKSGGLKYNKKGRFRTLWSTSP